MLVENTLFGKYDKEKVAIELLKTYEPTALNNHEDGYYVGFSAGKDSLVIAFLCILAGVKFKLYDNHTTVDTPELVYFTRKIQKWFKESHDVDVIINYPKETMWDLIPRKLMPPTRLTRYCCDILKEGGGMGRVCVMGVRWAESRRRASNRSLIEANAYAGKKKKIRLNNDNDESRKIVESCVLKGKHIINPIISWSDQDVWEFIRKYNIPYCELYDQGWERLGCIGCPLSSNQAKELEMYPKYKENYLRAFRRMTQARKAKGRNFWINESDAEEIMEWWIYGTIKNKPLEGQMEIELMSDLEELEAV